jgi:integrase
MIGFDDRLRSEWTIDLVGIRSLRTAWATRGRSRSTWPSAGQPPRRVATAGFLAGASKSSGRSRATALPSMGRARSRLASSSAPRAAGPYSTSTLTSSSAPWWPKRARSGPRGGLRPKTYASLFGLLAACGLRVSEALRLERSDVDLPQGVLLIRATKFRKSRLVPLHATTADALRGYAAERDRLVPHPAASTFFVHDAGGPLRYSTVRTVFLHLRRALGWARLEPHPRIHDLRHYSARLIIPTRCARSASNAVAL